MRTAVLTVAYPGRDMETFARECFHSLAGQTDCGFDVFVGNDGADYLADLCLPGNIAVTVEPVEGTPLDIRRYAIRRLLNDGYEIIVFADIDDCLAPNRIEVTKHLISSGGRIVFNDLELFGRDTPHPTSMLTHALHEGEAVDAHRIKHANCLGLSNTALHRDAMIDEALVPDNVVAFDWLFFSRLLLAGQQARFTAATTTRYRQHATNVATVAAWSDDNVKNGVRAKRLHYAALGTHAGYEELAAEFAVIDARMQSDDGFAARYCDAVRAAASRPAWWWEPIKTRKELNL